MQRKLNTSFIDQYSATFSEKVANQAFKGNKSITGKDILNVTPSKQVNFFILKILFTHWQEEMKRLESPYFDFKDAEVRKAMVAFMNTLSQKISIEKQHFEPLVKLAVGDTLMMLADPAGYLAIEFSNREHDDLTEKAAKTFLKYIKLHKYHYEQLLDKYTDSDLEILMAEADHYFEEADLLEATQNECVVLSEVEKISFAELFEEEEVEEEILEEEIPSEEEYSNEPVFALDEELIDDEEEIIAPKKHEEPEPELEESFQEEVEQEEHEDIEDEPTAEYAEEDDTDEELEENPEALEDADLEEDQEQEAVEEEDTYEEEEDETANWQVIVKEPAPIVAQEPKPSAPEPENTKEAEEEVEKEQQQLNDRLSAPQRTINDRFEEQERVTLADHHQQAKVNNVMEAISVNNRYMFTQELFDGDKEEFQKAISRIERCDSFDTAVELLVQDYSKVYHWDMNSEEVKELLKVVFRKFR